MVSSFLFNPSVTSVEDMVLLIFWVTLAFSLSGNTFTDAPRGIFPRPFQIHQVEVEYELLKYLNYNSLHHL